MRRLDMRTPIKAALDAAVESIGEVQAIAEPLTFRQFVREAWPIIEPGVELVDGWHLDAIAEFLQEITNGKISNGIINVPPRCMKSTLVSVLWQPWVWTFDPSSRWLFGSYDLALSMRDTVKARRVIASQWYQERWGGVFRMAPDQNAKARFENTKTGVRIATSVEGHGTGEGGKYVIADDPNKAQDAYSPAALERTATWWRGTMATRSDTPKQVRRLIIMQRISENDLTGHMLRTGHYTHLCLPMRYEKRIFDLLPKAPRKVDPRSEGDLLWPERFDAPSVAALESELGPGGTASQLQQLPSAAEGAIVKREQIMRWAAESLRPQDLIRTFSIVEVQIHFDGRAKEDPNSGSYVAIAVWGRTKDYHKFMLDLYRERVGYVESKAALETMIRKWPMARSIYVEAKASGHMVVSDLKHVVGLRLYEPGSSSKIERLEVVTPEFASGHVHLPADGVTSWAELAVGELCTFPRSANDDIVDTTSQALVCLGNGRSKLAELQAAYG